MHMKQNATPVTMRKLGLDPIVAFSLAIGKPVPPNTVTVRSFMAAEAQLGLASVYRLALRGATRPVRVSSAIGGKADLPPSRVSICSTSLTIKEILYK